MEWKMSKIAFIFPGQGAQYIGMAEEFYNEMPECREVFDIATKLMGFDVAKLCFEENENLNKTEYTQVAILTASVGILKAIERIGIKADVTAGLSLGEYSALVASGGIAFEDAVQLVRTRGLLMENEVPDGLGMMVALLYGDRAVIEQVCKRISEEEKQVVELANYNCPGQIVISGERNTVLKAKEKLLENGVKRAVELNVSGPFHSSMLKGAGDKLGKILKGIDFSPLHTPYISNVTAEIMGKETATDEIKQLLERQVYTSVKWQQSVENLIKEGTDIFVEIGPGKTLSAFVRKIDRTKSVLNIDKLEDLKKLKQLMEEKKTA